MWAYQKVDLVRVCDSYRSLQRRFPIDYNHYIDRCTPEIFAIKSRNGLKQCFGVGKLWGGGKSFSLLTHISKYRSPSAYDHVAIFDDDRPSDFWLQTLGGKKERNNKRQ